MLLDEHGASADELGGELGGELGSGDNWTATAEEEERHERHVEFGTTLLIPWFSIFGYINPSQHLTAHEQLNYIITALLWLYMFCVQIGMLNLLIAIMTDTYFKVSTGSSLSAWRMSRVATNYEFINASAVPEPFNLPFILF